MTTVCLERATWSSPYQTILETKVQNSKKETMDLTLEEYWRHCLQLTATNVNVRILIQKYLKKKLINKCLISTELYLITKNFSFPSFFILHKKPTNSASEQAAERITTEEELLENYRTVRSREGGGSDATTSYRAEQRRGGHDRERWTLSALE